MGREKDKMLEYLQSRLQDAQMDAAQARDIVSNGALGKTQLPLGQLQAVNAQLEVTGVPQEYPWS
jgi:hypothetical protein